MKGTLDTGIIVEDVDVQAIEEFDVQAAEARFANYQPGDPGTLNPERAEKLRGICAQIIDVGRSVAEKYLIALQKKAANKVLTTEEMTDLKQDARPVDLPAGGKAVVALKKGPRNEGKSALITAEVRLPLEGQESPVKVTVGYIVSTGTTESIPPRVADSVKSTWLPGPLREQLNDITTAAGRSQRTASIAGIEPIDI